MGNHDPDRLWKLLNAALEEEKEPEDEFLKAVYGVLRGTISDETIEYALDLIRNDSYREALIVFFLSGGTCSEISHSLNIPVAQLEIFQRLIIDVTAFKHKLHLLEFVHAFTAQIKNPKLASLLEAGMLMGPAAVEHHFQHGKEAVEFIQTELADRLLLVSFYKGIIAQGAAINSPESREALRWGQAFFKNVSLRENIGKDKNKEETEAFALIMPFRNTTTPDEADIEVKDILHGDGNSPT